MCCFVLGFAMGRLDCLAYVGGLGSAFLLCSVCLGCCDGDWGFDWLGWILGGCFVVEGFALDLVLVVCLFVCGFDLRLFSDSGWWWCFLYLVVVFVGWCLLFG